MQEETNLHFDKFFNSINDDKVLVASGRLAHEHLVACADPAAVVHVHERLRRGLLVVEVAQHHGRRLD